MANFSFNAPLRDRAIAQVPPLQFRAKLTNSRLLSEVSPQLSKGQTKVALDFQSLDESGVVLYSTGFIRLQSVRKSPQITELTGALVDVEATINLVFNQLEGTQTFRLSYTGDSRDVVSRDKYNYVLQSFRNSSQIRIANDHAQRVDLPHNPQDEQLSDGEKFTERMVHALAVIVEKTGTRLLLSEMISVNDVSFTEEIAKIFQTGIAQENLDIPENYVIGATIRLGNAIPFLNAQRDGVAIALNTPGGERYAEIQGHKISLGNALIEYQNVKVHNYDELNEMVKKGEPDDTPITIYFDIDREHIVTLFENWAEPEQLVANWIDVLSDDISVSHTSTTEEPSQPQLDQGNVQGSAEIVITEPPGTSARLAQIVSQMPILVEDTDIAERSREILNNEYADYLLKRLNRSNAADE